MMLEVGDMNIDVRFYVDDAMLLTGNPKDFQRMFRLDDANKNWT